MDFLPDVWYFGGAHRPPLNVRLLMAIDWGKTGFHYFIREYDSDEDVFICRDKWWFKIIEEPNDPLRTYPPVIINENKDEGNFHLSSEMKITKDSLDKEPVIFVDYTQSEYDIFHEM